MKKLKKYFACFALVFILCFCPVLTACSSSSSTGLTITNIEKTASNGLSDIYKIYYSDGSTYEFTIKNGSNGTDGQDGENLTIQEVYQEYVKRYGDISYADFLTKYLKVEVSDNSLVISRCLLSSLQIYSEFTVSSSFGYGPYQMTQKSISHSMGSAVIYKIDDDYTYILTNYHVVYSRSANSDSDGGIAYKIYGYLYGNESSPIDTGNTDEKGYQIYDYGQNGIAFEFVGGSIDYDIAVLKVETSKIKALNENVSAVECADEYHVGETAIAIGNPENEGISVSQGIVSVDNEFISLSIDGTSRSYRSVRIDTAIYSGSSGGGLFNAKGELIGITNAGDNSDQNINYAIPISIVKNVANNILENYDGQNSSTVKKITLGITISTSNTKYEYNQTLGYGKIVEDTIISEVTASSIASGLLLESGDKITSVYINDKKFDIDRYFDIGDTILQVKAGDLIKIAYERGSNTLETESYTVQASDLK